MDPKVNLAINEIQGLLTNIMTNTTLNQSEKDSFLSTYSSRLQSDIDSFMSSIKSQTDSFISSLNSLRDEISSGSSSITAAS